MAKSKTTMKSRGKKSPKARLVSSHTVYRGPVFWVTRDQVQEPGGVKVRRDLIHHSGSIVVLAVGNSRSIPRVLLERQYRHAAADYLWELPAGRIDPGEQELKAAQRELIEETGYRADRWRRILKFYASPGFVAETMSVFLATGLHAGEPEPEEDEIIQNGSSPYSRRNGDARNDSGRENDLLRLMARSRVDHWCGEEVWYPLDTRLLALLVAVSPPFCCCLLKHPLA